MELYYSYGTICRMAGKQVDNLIIIKKQGRVIFLVVLFLLGGMGLNGINPVTIYAAGGASSIGVVNYQFLVSQHPDIVAAQQAMDKVVAQAKSDFDAKSAGMNEQEKQALYLQLQQGIQQKNEELLAPINDKIMAAIKSVATAKGLAVVVNQGTPVYGGQDITNDVGKIIIGK